MRKQSNHQHVNDYRKWMSENGACLIEETTQESIRLSQSKRTQNATSKINDTSNWKYTRESGSETSNRNHFFFNRSLFGG